ncbi:MAG: CAP domain-containing protein [Nitrospiraceae bacterium]|nr:CAP domain-containing protein [Nitrospiraceae bacterium]
MAILLFPAALFAAERPRINPVTLEARIHQLIDVQRVKAGLKPLVFSRRLCAIARGHSRDMAQRDYFSHFSPEGESPLARYRQAGFSCRIRVGYRIYEGGENIFQNNLYSSVMYINGTPHFNWNSLEEIARSTVSGWMNSPGHRRNILEPVFRAEGIGVYIKGRKVYITEDFC